jgi:hypothetical protein
MCGPCKTISQNKPFLFVSHPSWVLCYSVGELSKTVSFLTLLGVSFLSYKMDIIKVLILAKIIRLDNHVNYLASCWSHNKHSVLSAVINIGLIPGP